MRANEFIAEGQSIGRLSKTKSYASVGLHKFVDPAHAAELMNPTSNTTTPSGSVVDRNTIFETAKKKALGGGKAGASAAVVQVLALMWLRTSMNYQYRYGGSLQEALEKLWKQGGVARLYQGLREYILWLQTCI
jgi:hypothetical protein